MSRQSLVTLVGVAALAVLVVAGCGGGEETLTKAEFIQQGDVICERGKQEVLDEYAKFGKAQGLKYGELGSAAQRSQFGLEVYLPSVEKRVDEIRDLNPPPAEEKQVENLLSAVEKAIAEATANPSLMASPAQNPLYRKPRVLTEAFGFKVCGIV